MTDKQLKRQVIVVKGLRKTRVIIEDSCDGWKMLGKHIGNKFVKFMEKKVLIGCEEKHRYDA